MKINLLRTSPLLKLHDPSQYNMYRACIESYCPVWTTQRKVSTQQVLCNKSCWACRITLGKYIDCPTIKRHALGFFVHNNLEAEAQGSYAHAALNKKREKTTYSVLSVLLLIYGLYGFTGYLNKHGNSDTYTKSSLLRFSVVMPNFILVMSILEYILYIR